MADIARLSIKVDSSGLVTAQKQTDKLARSGGKADKAFDSLKGAIGAVFAGSAIRQAIKYSDTITQINSRLGIVIKSHEELVAVQEELFAISQKNRVGYQETADLFFRIRRSFDETEVSTRDVIVATEALGRAIAISGGSAESANAAIIQLGQAFASGELRGEELRSVMEQTPRVAKALADALGTTVGGLRDMAEVGELTSDVVLKGLIDQADDLGKEFKSITPTIESAMTTLSNSVLKASGDMSEATGAGEALAETIMGISKAMDDFVASNEKFVKQGLPFAFDRFTQLVPVAGFLKDLSDVLRQAKELDQSGVRFPIPERPTRAAGPIGDKIGRTAKTGAAVIEPDLIDRINLIQESLKTEEQLETESYVKRFDALVTANELKLLSNEETNRLIEDEQKRHQEVLNDINESGTQQSNTILTNQQARTVSNTADFFGNMAQIAEAGGEKSFQAYKRLAQAQAGISAALSVISVLGDPTIPTLLRVPLAASIGALAAVQTAIIEKQQYSGRALGGQVQSGQSYIVGERGPELLTMGNNRGNITPNNKMGGGGDIKVTNVYQMSPGLPGTVRAEMMGMIPMITQYTTSAVESAISRGGSMSRAVGARR